VAVLGQELPKSVVREPAAVAVPESAAREPVAVRPADSVRRQARERLLAAPEAVLAEFSEAALFPELRSGTMLRFRNSTNAIYKAYCGFSCNSARRNKQRPHSKARLCGRRG
jgi:hypothetical protein